MLISEQFLMDNPTITNKPFMVFKAYNDWLKKSYHECPSEAGKKRFQEEADRFSEVYVECIRKLFIESV